MEWSRLVGTLTRRLHSIVQHLPIVSQFCSVKRTDICWICESRIAGRWLNNVENTIEHSTLHLTNFGDRGEKVYWLTRANCRRRRSMEILDEKVYAHLPYYSTLKKFWNGFFQAFQAGLLFFSGDRTLEMMFWEELCPEWLTDSQLTLSNDITTRKYKPFT